MELQDAKFIIDKNLEDLIQKIEPLTQIRNTNVDISQILASFYENVVKAESLLFKHGVVAINFGKATVILDCAFKIYEKKVTQLWDLAIDTERRHISYEDDSEKKQEAQELLEQKAQRCKRGRRKKAQEAVEATVDSSLLKEQIRKNIKKSLEERKFEWAQVRDIEKVDPKVLETFSSLIIPKSIKKKYPDEYLMKPYLSCRNTIDLNKEHVVNVANLGSSRIGFLLPEIMRKNAYHFCNGKVETVGCDVPDIAFQKYCVDHNINPCDITEEQYKSFESYLERYLIDGPREISLNEQRKKLCPRRSSVLLMRLSDDVIEQYLKKDHAETDSPCCEHDSQSDFTPCVSPEPPDVTTDENSNTIIEEQVVNRQTRSLKRKILIDYNKVAIKKIKKKPELIKWMKNVTVSLQSFEKFFCQNYLAESEEGNVALPDDLADKEDELQNESVCDVADNSNLEDSGFCDDNDLNLEEPEASQNEHDLSWESREMQDLLTRYLEWETYIKEELKSCKDHDYDIHEYGGMILDKIPDKETLSLRSIVNCKSSKEWCRFLNSTLHLATSGNVSLTNYIEGELANNLEVIVLSRERHHEKLFDENKKLESTIVESSCNIVKGSKRSLRKEENVKSKRLKLN